MKRQQLKSLIKENISDWLKERAEIVTGKPSIL